MNRIKNTLIQIHKLTGSFISLLFLMWFLTGFVLIFVGFPHASRQERFEHLEVLTNNDFKNIKAFPAAKGKVSLEKYQDQLVYRVYNGRRGQKVYDAKTLDHLSSFSQSQARYEAERFTGHTVSHIEEVPELDSWIPWHYYKPLLPFYKCYIDDAAHTVVYVSSVSGTIIQETNRQSRWWARLGAIPHWIYFKQLKSNDEVWKVVIVILCIIAILACLSGFWVAFYRVKRDENNRPVKLTVYKKWDYRWHHLLGWFLALLMTSFALSGIFYTTGVPSWLSAKPAGRSSMSQWNTTTQADSLIHPTTVWQQLPKKAGVRKLMPSSAMKQAVVNVFYDDYRRAETYQIIKHDSIAPFAINKTAVQGFAKQFFPDEEVNVSVQTNYDTYYELNGMFHHPLPVYRIDVHNDFETSLFIDPTTGKAVEYINTNKRARRWLTKALHKFEFPILEKHDWLRKTLLILVLLIGTFMCVTSVVLSYKWLRRVVRKVS